MFLLKYSYIFCYMLWSFSLYKTYIFVLNNPLHSMNLFEGKQHWLIFIKPEVFRGFSS
jgi:hypothetical protein